MPEVENTKPEQNDGLNIAEPVLGDTDIEQLSEEEKQQLLEKASREAAYELHKEGLENLKIGFTKLLTFIPNHIVFPQMKVNAQVTDKEVEDTGLPEVLVGVLETMAPETVDSPWMGLIISGGLYGMLIAGKINEAKKHKKTETETINTGNKSTEKIEIPLENSPTHYDDGKKVETPTTDKVTVGL